MRELLHDVQDAPSTLRFGLVLWGEPSPEAREALSMPLHTYAEVMARGSNSSHPNGNGSSVGTQQQLPPGPQPDDPATLVYTSGTSGNPKVGGFHADGLQQT